MVMAARLLRGDVTDDQICSWSDFAELYGTQWNLKRRWDVKTRVKYLPACLILRWINFLYVFVFNILFGCFAIFNLFNGNVNKNNGNNISRSFLILSRIWCKYVNKNICSFSSKNWRFKFILVEDFR